MVELKCSIDHDTLGKNPEGRKVKGVIHWVSAGNTPSKLKSACTTASLPSSVLMPCAAKTATICRLPISSIQNPSRKSLPTPNLSQKICRQKAVWQFERIGYFVTDRKDHSKDMPVFNRTVTLKDSWQP